MAKLAALARDIGAELVDSDLGTLPPSRREVELLMTGGDIAELQGVAQTLCAKAFGSVPVAGVVTFVSRGTDDDAAGVLAGFGLTGVIDRVAGGQGWDIVTVTLDKADLARIPESRIHTALEATLNCEVRIVTT